MSQSKIHNFFVFHTKDIETGEEKEYRTENVVLDKAYKRMFDDTFGMWIKYMSLGSDPTPALPTDTALKAGILNREILNGTWNVSEFKIGGSGICTFSGSIRVQASELVGQNIAEVGLGQNSTSSVYTRAVLQDANGNPLIISKTNTMVLDVYATAFTVVPKTHSGYNSVRSYFYLNESFINYAPGKSIELRETRHDRNWSEPITKPVTMTPGATATFEASSTTDSANLKRSFALANIEAGQGNVNGIRSIVINDIEIPVPNNEITQPAIIKEVVGTGDGIRKDFATKFGWIRNNGTCRVYVNDVEQVSGVNIDFNRYPSGRASVYVMENKGGTPTKFHNTSGKKMKSLRQTYSSTVYWDASLDGVSWVGSVISNIPNNIEFPIPEQYQTYPYWRPGHNNYLSGCVFSCEGDILFDVAPPEGATITVTYQPDCIAKDETKTITNLTYTLGF